MDIEEFYNLLDKCKIDIIKIFFYCCEGKNIYNIFTGHCFTPYFHITEEIINL